MNAKNGSNAIDAEEGACPGETKVHWRAAASQHSFELQHDIWTRRGRTLKCSFASLANNARRALSGWQPAQAEGSAASAAMCAAARSTHSSSGLACDIDTGRHKKVDQARLTARTLRTPMEFDPRSTQTGQRNGYVTLLIANCE